MEGCYESVADYVTPEEWSAFVRKLVLGFKGFPESWGLPDLLRERLVLKLQWEFLNPDLVTGLAEKRSRSWSFMRSFLCDAFQRKFTFLRGRQERAELDRWDGEFADFEKLLYLSSMNETLQMEWLSNFDARIRYGEARRAKVLKNTAHGLGLSSELLGVHVLMGWEEVKARYRFMVKKHHPDVGGDPAMARQIIEEYQRLAAAAGKKE